MSAQMEEWEIEEERYLLVQLSLGTDDKVDCLHRYCHEGLSLREDNGVWTAAVCSEDAAGTTRAAAVSALAEKILKRVRDGSLGC